MSEKILKITYKCLHPSCVVFCRTGELYLPETKYAELSSVNGDSKTIKSPKNACRLGYSQKFDVLSVEEAVAEDLEEDNLGQFANNNPQTDPIAALIEEHKKVLEKADNVERLLATRNLDDLWVATADLDNILHLHSGLKEEEILFPALRGLVPFGEGLVACINEDHREIVSLIYSFREALRDGTINDKIIGSALVALNSHTRKEDNEFFEFVRRYITEDMKGTLMKAMEQAEKSFVPSDPGERLPDEAKAAERAWFHGKAIESKEMACDTCCH